MGSFDGVPRDDIDWGPTIDGALCSAGCSTCLDFCRQGVYERVDAKVRVVRRTSCVVGCSHCASLCEGGAITFPTLEDLRRAHPRP